MANTVTAKLPREKTLQINKMFLITADEFLWELKFLLVNLFKK